MSEERYIGDGAMSFLIALATTVHEGNQIDLDGTFKEDFMGRLDDCLEEANTLYAECGEDTFEDARYIYGVLCGLLVEVDIAEAICKGNDG